MRRAIIIFSRLQDMREEKKVLHKLLDIVIITIIAVMCGCTDWEEVSTFGRARAKILCKYLELKNGIPSHDTFRRVMGMIRADALEECYRQWVKEILGSARLEEKKGDNIGIDGKTVRGSGKPGLKPIHMISAWSSRAGLTLAQLKTNEKSNEITAIPDLLEVLDIAGSIVTIDAMGCQTNIAKAIVAGKGEIEECKMLSRFHDFEGAKSIGRASSRVTFRNGNIRSDKRYFITSLAKEQAIDKFAQAVRNHWGIENSCHWVLDVTFGEDACRTRDEIAAQNLSLARKLALALAKRVPDEVVERYSHNKAKYTSLKKRLFLAGLYPDFMVEILLAGA
jgi:predicted transposase YbfD/YdcC